MQPKEPTTPPRPSGASRALEGKALAGAKREQMRLRASRIRQTIALTAAGLFAAAFLGVYVQLASGHDPALAAVRGEAEQHRRGSRRRIGHERRGRKRERLRRIRRKLAVLRDHLPVMSDEAIERFECFGGTCVVLVQGDGPAGSAHQAAALAREQLLEWHTRFSRFIADSELSRLNRDPRAAVPVSPLMARLARSIADAGDITGGLVDGTLVGQIEQAGYDEDLTGSVELARTLALAPPRRAARAGSQRRWRELRIDPITGTLLRPPGLKLDSGGLAKGMFADVLGEWLSGHRSFAVNCGGDLLVGGTGGAARAIEVQSPFDGSILHVFEERSAGVATSGIGRRSWIGADGRPAHHLLDPSTGSPAFTGIVQVSALAPTALVAEARAKAAVLAGPLAARRWLPQGGVIVLEDGSHEVIERPPTVTIRRDERGAAVLRVTG